MVLKGQECLLTRDLIVTSTLRFGGCRIYYKMKYLYDIYSHDCLHMYINNNVSFGMVLFCKCVREFGKVWAFARAEFGMGGTGICPSPQKFMFIRFCTSGLASCSSSAPANDAANDC